MEEDLTSLLNFPQVDESTGNQEAADIVMKLDVKLTMLTQKCTKLENRRDNLTRLRKLSRIFTEETNDFLQKVMFFPLIDPQGGKRKIPHS